MNNPTKATLYQPVQGPQASDPFARRLKSQIKPEANVAVDETTFHESERRFSGRVEHRLRMHRAQP